MNWRELFETYSDIPAEKLRWWLSDRLELPLTRLPMADTPSPALRADFEAAAARLAAGEPVQYVCGRAPFRDLELMVDRRVLIPRPETEQLVRIALDRLIRPGDRVLDVGTGSGCIALAVKRRRPDCRVAGVDVSEQALEVARANAEKLNLEVEFRRADLLTGESEGSWDVVLANLPYIGETERQALPAEVRDHEPALALFAGPDGTGLLIELMDQARRALAPGGRVLLETGETQRVALESAADRLGWRIEGLRDLAGRERFWILTKG